ncbi:MAG: hypothetical protein KDD01_08545 [Phaeodactylibacter sp.]|nr:hypothetical protein [Phaeodactylibacter sp.]
MVEKKSKPLFHSKLYQAVFILSKNQKNDLLAFMKMPSNGLSEHDQQMMKAFLNKMDIFRDGAREEAFWEKQLKDTRTQKKHVMNRLLKALERYLALNALEQNAPLYYTLLAAFYSEKGIGKNAAFCIRKARKLVNAPKNRNLEEGLIEYRLYELEAHQARNKREPSRNLEFMETALKRFYCVHQMRILGEQANRQHIIRENHDALAATAQYCQGDTEELIVYRWLFIMVNDNDRTAYQQLNTFMQKNEDFFSSKFQKEIIEALMNFCVRYVNMGEKQYAEDYLTFIELLDKKGLLLEGGLLPIHRFPNCLLIAILLGRLEWARAFFAKYGSKLLAPKEFKRQPFLDFYQAIIELYDGHPQTGMKLLGRFQTSDMYLKDAYYKIASDKMLLMFFYQQEDFSPILARIDSLKKYIWENIKLAPSRKAPHLAFLKILRQLANHKQVAWVTQKDQLFPMDYLWLERILL